MIPAAPDHPTKRARGQRASRSRSLFGRVPKRPLPHTGESRLQIPQCETILKNIPNSLLLQSYHPGIGSHRLRKKSPAPYIFSNYRHWKKEIVQQHTPLVPLFFSFVSIQFHWFLMAADILLFPIVWLVLLQYN